MTSSSQHPTGDELTTRLDALEARVARLEQGARADRPSTAVDELDTDQRAQVNLWRTAGQAESELLSDEEREALTTLVDAADQAAARHAQLRSQLHELADQRNELGTFTRRRLREDLDRELEKTRFDFNRQWDGTGQCPDIIPGLKERVTVEDASRRLDTDTERRGRLQPDIEPGHAALDQLTALAHDRITAAVERREQMPVWFDSLLGTPWPGNEQGWVDLAVKVVLLRWFTNHTDPVVPLPAAKTSPRPVRGDWDERDVEQAIKSHRDRARAAR